MYRLSMRDFDDICERLEKYADSGSLTPDECLNVSLFSTCLNLQVWKIGTYSLNRLWWKACNRMEEQIKKSPEPF